MPGRSVHRDQRQQRLQQGTPADPVAEARNNSGANPAPSAVLETERANPLVYALFSRPLNAVI
jgi:hypothetical protein